MGPRCTGLPGPRSWCGWGGRLPDRQHLQQSRCLCLPCPRGGRNEHVMEASKAGRCSGLHCRYCGRCLGQPIAAQGGWEEAWQQLTRMPVRMSRMRQGSKRLVCTHRLTSGCVSSAGMREANFQFPAHGIRLVVKASFTVYTREMFVICLSNFLTD